ncbi:NAD(P)-dependent oxidoreductase [Tessaracoccus massiliensis]|uniref:NAD(P)-dependent oxidoreductase n=1 Tax=Tessaracoccus massiliensis TaxID=1522311 RepID=UPI00058F99A0|nr:NAD(P)-binding oxidoreductase [Tessaracoccus massiliensis]
MRITVIGGNSGTGAERVRLAAERGHDVTCFSRSGAKDLPVGALDVRGDALDHAAVKQAIDGADAVVVTVGGAKGSSRHRAKVTRSVIRAMRDAGVRRLIVQSSLGAGDSGALMALPGRLIAKTVLAAPLADHNDQEAAVFASGLDWTVVRPGGLNDKPATGAVVAQETAEGRAMKAMISRADVAEYIVSILDDATTHGKALGLGTG